MEKYFVILKVEEGVVYCVSDNDDRQVLKLEKKDISNGSELDFVTGGAVVQLNEGKYILTTKVYESVPVQYFEAMNKYIEAESTIPTTGKTPASIVKKTSSGRTPSTKEDQLRAVHSKFNKYE